MVSVQPWLAAGGKTGQGFSECQSRMSRRPRKPGWSTESDDQASDDPGQDKRTEPESNDFRPVSHPAGFACGPLDPIIPRAWCLRTRPVVVAEIATEPGFLISRIDTFHRGIPGHQMPECPRVRKHILKTARPKNGEFRRKTKRPSGIRKDALEFSKAAGTPPVTLNSSPRVQEPFESPGTGEVDANRAVWLLRCSSRRRPAARKQKRRGRLKYGSLDLRRKILIGWL